jgi:phosphoribosylformimino-5-aminoimidazole carboxamide ribotide isomerase
MRAIPAIDLRDGRCVQLVGGDYAKEAIRLDDPLEVAQKWVAAGFDRLHVVDLDAATGRGDNRDLVREIIQRSGVPVQVGGGVRTAEAIDDLLDDGADHVVVGTRGVEDTRWLEDQAARVPGRLVLAADVRGRTVVSRGWTKETTREILDLITELHALPLGGLLVTAVQQEGKMQGTDLALMADVADTAPWPLIASGGVGSMLDLRALADRGVAAVVLGMALYTEALDPRVVAEEFNG